MLGLDHIKLNEDAEYSVDLSPAKMSIPLLCFVNIWAAKRQPLFVAIALGPTNQNDLQLNESSVDRNDQSA